MVCSFIFPEIGQFLRKWNGTWSVTRSLLSFSLATNNAPLHTMTNYLERIAPNERVGRKDNISISILKNSRKLRKKKMNTSGKMDATIFIVTQRKNLFFFPTRPVFFSSYFSQSNIIGLDTIPKAAWCLWAKNLAL